MGATKAAVEASEHLIDADGAAVAALLVLAGRIDDGDARDNVSLPTYLKYCEALGLTPAGRDRLKEKKPEAVGGKLGKLRSVPKPA